MPTKKKVTKKRIVKQEEFTDAMQDNILLTALMQMVKHAFELQSTPHVSYWPSSHTIEMRFLEDEGLDPDQMRRFGNLCDWPVEARDGMPTYYIRAHTEVYDHEKAEMVKLIGMLEVDIQMEFSKQDWELMTKAERGAIVTLKENTDE